MSEWVSERKRERERKQERKRGGERERAGEIEGDRWMNKVSRMERVIE